MDGDFLSLYMARNDAHLSSYVNGQNSALTFSPSPNKYDRNKYEHHDTVNGHQQSQMNGNMNGHQGPQMNGDGFCHQNNIQDCAEHLNQELTSIGMQGLYQRGSMIYDPVCLINCTYDLLEQFRRNGRVREDLEDRMHRLESDLTHAKETERHLVRKINQCEQDVALGLERERKLALQNKQLAAKLKSEKDEVKRLQSVLQHRDVQHKHETRKKEREHLKLKERLHNMLTDKKANKIGMTLSNVLQRPDGSRGTWSGTKQEEELFRSVIRNYEERTKELMVENSGLRSCLGGIQSELLHNKVSDDDGSTEICPDVSRVNLDLPDGDSVTYGHGPTSPRGQVQLPFEYLEGTLLKSINERCRQLKKHIKQLEKQTTGSNTQKQVVELCRSPSKEDRQEQKDLEKLVKDIERYKDIVDQQEQFIQDTMAKNTDHNPSFLNESDLVQEKENLDMQKKLFDEQRSNFQKERNVFTEATVRLNKERKSFEESKATFLKDQFLQITPFNSKAVQRHNNATSNLLKHTAKRESVRYHESPRLLPNVPDNSPPPSVKHLQTPTTVELYRVLGLNPRNRSQARPLSADPVSGLTPGGMMSQRIYSPPWASSGPRRCSSAINRTATPNDKIHDTQQHMTDVKTLLFDHKCTALDLSDGEDGQH